MNYKKAKTKSEIEKEKGLEINLCSIDILSVKKDQKKIPKFKATVELVYKQIKKDHNQDKYLKNRIEKLLLTPMKGEEFIIKSVTKLKFIGYGIYEE